MGHGVGRNQPGEQRDFINISVIELKTVFNCQDSINKALRQAGEAGPTWQHRLCLCLWMPIRSSFSWATSKLGHLGDWNRLLNLTLHVGSSRVSKKNYKISAVAQARLILGTLPTLGVGVGGECDLRGRQDACRWRSTEEELWLPRKPTVLPRTEGTYPLQGQWSGRNSSQMQW